MGIQAVLVEEIAVSKSRETAKRMTEEAEKLAARVPEGAHVVLLDARGKGMTSEDFAEMLAALRDAGTRDMAFVIGGPDGLAPLPGKKAGRSLAFGPQTWPHLMVRAMLSEQIYRALTILAGIPITGGRHETVRFTISPKKTGALSAAAHDVSANAYAPYSGFAVGAARAHRHSGFSRAPIWRTRRMGSASAPKLRRSPAPMPKAISRSRPSRSRGRNHCALRVRRVVTPCGRCRQAHPRSRAAGADRCPRDLLQRRFEDDPGDAHFRVVAVAVSGRTIWDW